MKNKKRNTERSRVLPPPPNTLHIGYFVKERIHQFIAHSIMLFLLLAALSALKVLVAIALAALSFSAAALLTGSLTSMQASSSGGSVSEDFLSLVLGLEIDVLLVKLGALVLLFGLVELLFFTVPLPVRLCKDGRAPPTFPAFRSSRDEAGKAEEVGTEECRRALRAALARSLIPVRGALGG